MKSFHNRFMAAGVSVAVAATLVVAVSACGSSSGARPPSHKGTSTLRWFGLAGTPTWANTLDPAMVTDSISYNIIGMVNAGLVKLVPSGNAAPDLASGWKISANRKVYTFTLRPNLHFNNGDKLTASDVAWSITRSLAKATASPVALSYLGHIAGATAYSSGKAKTVTGLKVLSPTKIQITLDQPIAFFLKTLTYPTADVLDPRIVAHQKPQTFITNTCGANVGAGQFKFACRNKSTGLNSFFPPGQTHTMTLVANPRYYGPKPHVKVVMPAIPDQQTNYKDYQAGSIDATTIPSPDIALNRGKPGFLTYPTSVTDYITPNEKVPPFNNLHCRLALSYAINRDAINNSILHHSQMSYYDVVPKGMLGYYNGANNPHFDPALARSELAKCPGGINGVTVTYQHTSADIDNEYKALTNMWRTVGINIRTQPLTFNAWLGIVGKSLQATKTKLTENLWIEDYPDPYDYCSLLLRGGENYDIGGYNNLTYNNLVDKAAVEANTATRASMYIRAQHMAVSHGAWIPVGNQIGYALINPKVHGFVGSEAFGIPVPKNNDWSNITIS